MSSGGLLPAGTRLDTGELMWTPIVTRRHQRISRRWCRREHAMTGADQTRVTLSSEGRPLLAVSGSSWGPACCVVASSLNSVWSLAIAGAQGTGFLVGASVHPSQVLVEAGVTPAVHLHRPSPSATPGCGTCGVGCFQTLGPPCNDDPVSSSAVTGALVAGRAIT